MKKKEVKTMKNKKENKENTELPNSEGLSENMDIKENMENKNITENTDIEKEYFNIQKEITEKSKKGDFQGIVNLLKENSDIIEKYQQYQKQKEEEKKQKLQQIEDQIQQKIREIDILKSEIRDLKQKKKEIQGNNTNNNNSNSTRVVNRISHEYTWNNKTTNKAIDIIYMVLSEYGITKEAWDNFNHEHSISWNYFIEQVKQGKYPQKINLQKLLNSDDLNTFYQKVKEITIS